MEITKLKELKKVKENLKNDVLSHIGLEELRSSPLMSIIAEFELSAEYKYPLISFAQLMTDNYMVSVY